MELLLQKLEQNKNWKDLLRASCKNNSIPTSLAGQLTILKARSLYKRFQKTYQRECEKQKYYWGQNELKSFHWILICVSATSNIKIVDFTQTQWMIISNIFKYKQMSVLQYQAAKLLFAKVKKSKSWTQQEQTLLISIIKRQQDQNYKWNQIGRFLYSMSKKIYFRTGKQCRQKWFNHLDPKKKRGSWTKDEDLKLLELADAQNRKWAKIVKSFHSQRTQHMIKNRFKSLLVKQKRLTPNIRKQQKLIEALKQTLKSTSIQKIQHQESFSDSQVSCQQKQELIKQQKQQCHQQNIQKHTSQLLLIQSLSAIQEQKQLSHVQKSHGSIPQQIDMNISNYFQQASQTNRQQFSGFKMYSPYCIAYTMGNSLTPTGLTPTYFSPPAFYMNSFTQNMMSFQKYLNNPETDANNNT